MNAQNTSLDALFEDLDLNRGNELSAEDRGAITLWIPKAYIEKYGEIQEKTKRRFGKKLQEMVMRSIDKLDAAS